MLVDMARATRQRIAEEALRLFAEKGYAGTSVADIERAAGLKPGAGGLYAHFDSKRDVLAAAVESAVAVADGAYALHGALPLDDLRSELTVIVRGSLQLFEATGDWIRVRLREAQRFPELFAGNADLSARAYRYLSGWLRAKAADGVLVDHDCDATAQVLFGAISSYWQRESLHGRQRGGVSRERFIAAWVDLAERLAAPADSNALVS
jgi:AcrR family transcriptional regulator